MGRRCERTKKAIILLTVDPTSPDQTVIGYSASFSRPDDIPRGSEGAKVLAAILRANFTILDMNAADDYVQFVLYNRSLSRRDRDLLERLYDRIGTIPES